MTTRTTIEGMAEWLKGHDDFVIIGHVAPDGDTSGSCLGLWHALRERGKRAVVLLSDGVPKLYADLPGVEDVITDVGNLPFAPQTALSVDVSELERLGDEGMAAFDSCPCRGAIDHHATNPGFGDIMLLDGEAAAAGELAVEVVEAMGGPLSKTAAECLFVAISTDTGHFSYSSVRVQTFKAAERCAAAGIDIDGITARLYRTRSLARTKLLGLVLAGLRVSDDGRMAWAYLSEAMLREAGAAKEDNEGIVNYLQEIQGVKFAVLIQERGSQCKLSLRSVPPLDVAEAVALPLGGGGHACAAGATVDMPMEAAAHVALDLAAKALRDAP